jgi:hypothetical protein
MTTGMSTQVEVTKIGKSQGSSHVSSPSSFVVEIRQTKLVYPHFDTFGQTIIGQFVVVFGAIANTNHDGFDVAQIGISHN